MYSPLVCLFVSRIIIKLLALFSRNLVERLHMGHGRNLKIFI